jgi:hypothetical protein
MSDQVTLTNPANPNEKWTSGKRGKPPTWVQLLKAAGTIVPTKTVASKQLSKNTQFVLGALRVWRYVGQAGELGDNEAHSQQGHCMIIASDEINACLVANPTFINPVSQAELNTLWKEVEDAMVADIHAGGIDVTIPCIYESNGQCWVPRKKSLMFGNN